MCAYNMPRGIICDIRCRIRSCRFAAKTNKVQARGMHETCCMLYAAMGHTCMLYTQRHDNACAEVPPALYAEPAAHAPIELG